MQRMEQAHGKTARARQTSRGRQISYRTDVNGRIDFQKTQTFASNIVLDLINVIDQLGAGIVDANWFVVQFAVTFDRDVGVLIDGDAEHSAVIALVKISEISAAAGEADAKRGTGYDDSWQVVTTRTSHALSSSRKGSPS